MMIIQNCKNYYNAIKETNRICDVLVRYEDCITKNCSQDIYKDNIKKEREFKECVSAPTSITGMLDFIKNAERNMALVNHKAIECRASSCLYKYKNDVRKCINVGQDKSLTSVRCAGCSHFKELWEYQSLMAQLETAINKEQQAKQKLLNSFHFGKTK